MLEQVYMNSDDYEIIEFYTRQDTALRNFSTICIRIMNSCRDLNKVISQLPFDDRDIERVSIMAKQITEVSYDLYEIYSKFCENTINIKEQE